jgi:hypothetical protein
MAAQHTRANGARAVPLALAFVSTALLSGCVRDACNNECTTGTVCDATLAACVSTDDGGSLTCKQDSDCPAGQARCNAGGLCVQCLTTSDCPGGQSCNARSNTCIAGCTGAADCANIAGKHQCNIEGECVECTSSVHCTALNGMHRTCDQGTNTCVVNPCTIDADCAEDPSGARYCESGGCVQCHMDSDCVVPGKSHCTAPAHQCAQCVADSDCNVVNGESCVENACKKTGCGADSDCPADGHCDTTTHGCVTCLQDADCLFGGTCQNKHCGAPTSCHADADCLYGTFCASGACAACRTSSDCEPGQTCRAGTCQQPASCTSSEVCGSGQACLGGSCQLLTCVPDSFESNNLPQDAAPLPTMASISLNASFCPNQPDYFVLALDVGQGLTVTAQPTYQGGDTAANAPFSLDLIPGPVSAGGAVHGQITRTGAVTATLERMPAGARVVLIRIAGNVSAATPYVLSAVVAPGALCANDTREPDDTQTQASVVSPGSFPGTLCQSDSDWFAVDVPENQRPIASLTSDAAAADLGLSIYTLKNGTVTLDTYSFTDAQGASHVTASSSAATGGQRFWVNVYSASGFEHHYTVKIENVANPPPNDRCENATTLVPNASAMPNTTTSGALVDETASCGGAGGDAFWSLTLGATSRVEVDLAASFNAVLSLEEACGPTNELECAGGAVDSQHLNFEALPAGTYKVRVAGATSSNFGSYSLTATTQPAVTPTNASCNLPIALFFTSGEAQVMGTVAGVQDGLPGCGRAGGEAVYAFTLTEPTKLDVNLSGFVGASLTLATHDNCSTLSSGQCLAADSHGVAALSIFAVPAGDYVLVVDGGTAVSGTYTLDVRTSAAIFPPDNDSCSTAMELTSGSAMFSGDTRAAVNDFTAVCAAGAAGDAVYHLAVTTPQEVALQLSANFDAALELTEGTCGSTTAVDCQLGSSALIRQVLPVGDYYLWVDGNSGGTGVFTLSSSIHDAPPVPTNQSCATATAISAGTVSGTTTTADAANAIKPSNCRGAGSTSALPLNGPNVVYAVTIPAGKTLAATLHPTDFDGAIYVVDSCATSTCVAASDTSYAVGGTELLSVPNTSGSARAVFLVVGSWDASAWGAFTLDVTLN